MKKLNGSDLTREWVLDCDAAGIVTIRRRHKTKRRGKDKPQGLPVFSVDLVAHAIALRALHCVLSVDQLGDIHYQLMDPPNHVGELLSRVTPMFYETYQRMIAGDTAPEREALEKAVGACPGCGQPCVIGKATCGRPQCGPAVKWS